MISYFNSSFSLFLGKLHGDDDDDDDGDNDDDHDDDDDDESNDDFDDDGDYGDGDYSVAPDFAGMTLPNSQ